MISRYKDKSVFLEYEILVAFRFGAWGKGHDTSVIENILYRLRNMGYQSFYETGMRTYLNESKVYPKIYIYLI